MSKINFENGNIIFSYSNEAFIYLNSVIKERGEKKIFIPEKEYNHKTKQFDSFNFPFNISNKSLAKINRKAIFFNDKNAQKIELRIVSIFYPKIIKRFAPVSIGFELTLKK